MERKVREYWKKYWKEKELWNQFLWVHPIYLPTDDLLLMLGSLLNRRSKRRKTRKDQQTLLLTSIHFLLEHRTTAISETPFRKTIQLLREKKYEQTEELELLFRSHYGNEENLEKPMSLSSSLPAGRMKRSLKREVAHTMKNIRLRPSLRNSNEKRPSLPLYEILRTHPEWIASALTYLDREFFLALDIEDLAQLSEDYSPSKVVSSGIQHLRDQGEKIFQWTQNETLIQSEISQCAWLLERWVSVGEILLEHKNFNALFAILGALDYSLIARLKPAWKKVSLKKRRKLKELFEWMNPCHNYRKYRSLSKFAFIPCFGILIRDLTYLFKCNPKFVQKSINPDLVSLLAEAWARLRRLQEVQPWTNLKLTVVHRLRSLTLDQLVPPSALFSLSYRLFPPTKKEKEQRSTPLSVVSQMLEFLKDSEGQEEEAAVPCEEKRSFHLLLEAEDFEEQEPKPPEKEGETSKNKNRETPGFGMTSLPPSSHPSFPKKSSSVIIPPLALPTVPLSPSPSSYPLLPDIPEIHIESWEEEVPPTPRTPTTTSTPTITPLNPDTPKTILEAPFEEEEEKEAWSPFKKKGSSIVSDPSAFPFWDSIHVETWLKQVGEEKYIPWFVSHEISGRELLMLMPADLKEIGIDCVGARLRLISKIRESFLEI